MTSARVAAHARVACRWCALLACEMADAASAQPINGRGRWCATFSRWRLDCAYRCSTMHGERVGVSDQCSLNPWYADRD